MEEQFKLFQAEYSLMMLIWENEPINSTALIKLCNESLGWKKSTTYTMIKKLQDRKVVESENAVVTSIVKHHEVRKYESEKIMSNVFNNSLPKFLTAFLQDNKLNEKEIEELKKIIEESKG